MKKKNTYGAFTLIEVLVVIAVIGIIALGISSLDFNRLSQKQKIQIETGKIVSSFEEVRNYALIGKGVGTNLVTPTQWQITFENTSSSGSMDINYMSGTSLQDYADWESPFPFEIRSIECQNLNNTSQTSTGSGVLIFRQGNISIEGCSSIDKPKILEIEYGIGTNIKTININTLSGIIE